MMWVLRAGCARGVVSYYGRAKTACTRPSENAIRKIGGLSHSLRAGDARRLASAEWRIFSERNSRIHSFIIAGR